MSEQPRLTLDELQTIFGDFIPIEAAKLLQSWTGTTDDLRAELQKLTIGREWRCFHCDEVFTDPQLARDHFGAEQLATPVCQIPDLAHLLRLQEYELRGHREEDSKLIREAYAAGADHARKLQDEEEKGYARGLKDGRGLTDELVKQVRRMLAHDGFGGTEFRMAAHGDARRAVVHLLKDFPE